MKYFFSIFPQDAETSFKNCEHDGAEPVVLYRQTKPQKSNTDFMMFFGFSFRKYFRKSWLSVQNVSVTTCCEVRPGMFGHAEVRKDGSSGQVLLEVPHCSLNQSSFFSILTWFTVCCLVFLSVSCCCCFLTQFPCLTWLVCFQCCCGRLPLGPVHTWLSSRAVEYETLSFVLVEFCGVRTSVHLVSIYVLMQHRDRRFESRFHPYVFSRN